MIISRGGIAPSRIVRFCPSSNSMERGVKGNFHARCGAGENSAIVSKNYLSLSGAKSQGMKQLMAGGGIAVVGLTLIPLLAGLF